MIPAIKEPSSRLKPAIIGISMNFFLLLKFCGVSGSMPLGPSTTGPKGPASDPC